MEGLKRRAVTSLASSYASQFGTTAADFLSKLVLARLILPDQWGLFAEAMMVVLMADVFTDLGLSQHVVREKSKPFGTVLLVRMILSVVAVAVVEAFAPVLGRVFTPLVVAPARVLAPLILIRAIGSVPTVFVDRELVVHKSLAPQFARLAVNAGVSIVMAMAGFGVWALIAGSLASEVAYSGLMWLSVRRQISVRLTLDHARSLISGSRMLFLIAVISIPLQQGDVFVVGSLLDARTVGLYTMALTLVTRVSKVVEVAIFRVIYPMFCQVADDTEKLGRIYRCMTLAIIAIEAPIYAFLLFHSGFFVSSLLGHKWMPMAPILQALAMAGVANPFGTFGMEVMRATKRDKSLFMASIVAAITIFGSGYLLTHRFGVMGMVAANYMQVSALFIVPVLWRTIKPQFTLLVHQIVVVYALSLGLSGAAFVIFGGTTRHMAGIAVVIVLWLTFYRLYGVTVGKETLRSL